MILKHSIKGIPYICLGGDYNVSFCKMTSTDNLYKHVIVKILLTIKDKKLNFSEYVNYMTNLKFTKTPNNVKKSKDYKNSDILDLKKMIKKYLNKDGYFLKSDIVKLSKDIDSFNNGEHLK